MRRIIITGSEGLIGRELSSFFEQKGDCITRCDLSLGHDLTNELFVKSFFEQHKAEYLINLFALNHHITKDHSSDEAETLFNISLDSFNAYLHTNLTSLFSVCREFARNNKHSAIVNFASMYAIVSPDPRIYDRGEKHIAYGVSKAGVIQLTRHLAVHLAPDIRVNCVISGGIEAGQSNAFKERYNARNPLGRMMQISELNGLLDYLCSPQSAYMTGEAVTIDGGWSIW